MPFPTDPPIRAPLLAGEGAPAPIWAQWFAAFYRTVVPTSGVFYIPAASGPPTGTPEARVGFVPMKYDTANDDLYVYNGAWVKVTLT